MRDEWRTSTVGDIAETRVGKTLPKGGGSDIDGKPYLRNVNVQWNPISTEVLNRMHFNQREMDALMLKRNDILVYEGGEVGCLALVREGLDGIFFQSALHRVRVVDPKIMPEYLALFLRHFVKNWWTS